MNENDKRLSECSMEELEEEMHKRKRSLKESGANENNTLIVQYMPDASTLSCIVAYKRLVQLADPEVVLIDENDSVIFEFPTEHVLFLLRCHPSLVAVPVSFHKRTILSYFLQARSDLATIKELCQMHKMHLPTANAATAAATATTMPVDCYYSFNRQPNPIADYCLYGRGEDGGVLGLLLENFPQMILQKDREGYMPFDLLLQRWNNQGPHPNLLNPKLSERISLEEVIHTVEEMLSVCPHMLESCSRGHQYLVDYLQEPCHADYYLCCANRARHEGKPHFDGLMYFLFEKFAQKSNIQCLQIPRLKTFMTHHVLAVSRILPKLKKLDCFPDNMDHHTYYTFLNSLYNSSLLALEALRITILLFNDADDAYFKYLILGIVRKCIGLKRLILFLPPDQQHGGHTPGSYFLGLCKDTMCLNRIESLKLCVREDFTSRALSNLFLSFPSCLKSVSLQRLYIVNVGGSPCHYFTPNCCLENIELGEMDLSTDWTKDFLSQLVDLPSLKVLDLKHEDIQCDELPSITGLLVDILKANRCQSIKLRDIAIINCDILSKALCQNTSLNELAVTFSASFSHCGRLTNISSLVDVLAQQNVTLEKLTFPDAAFLEDVQRIVYYTGLNRHGRAAMQDGTASLADLVGYLCGVEEDSVLEDLVMKHSVQLGLLQLSLSIWSGFALLAGRG